MRIPSQNQDCPQCDHHVNIESGSGVTDNKMVCTNPECDFVMILANE